MKIDLDLESGTMVEITLANGKTLTEKDIEGISFDPYFKHRREVVEFAKLTARTSGGKEVDASWLTVSGATGRMGRKESSSQVDRVVPLIDVPKDDPQPEPLPEESSTAE